MRQDIFYEKIKQISNEEERKFKQYWFNEVKVLYQS